MRVMDKKTAGDGVKLLVFVVVTALATGLLVITIGNISFRSTQQYKAVFSDATDVANGDDVRIAGVKVGTVQDVSIYHATKALVTFSVDSDRQLTQSTHATIRYRNLVGERYIALTQGQGSGGVLSPGATIPLARTAPALDLTVLFNGFKPLFQALNPHDVNKLAYEIIRVFQGEGGTLDGLLAHTASVTSTLANRDQIIGRLITNLNQVMTTVGNRDAELAQLLGRLRQLVSGLTQDRHAILGSLTSISHLTEQTAGLVTGIRPGLQTDIKQLGNVAGTLDRNKSELDRAIKVLPIKLDKIGSTATYGSWFNFYLCNFTGRLKLPGGKSVPLSYNTGSARCNLG